MLAARLLAGADQPHALALVRERERASRQTAVGVNYHDVYVRSGLYRTLDLPGIPGIETFQGHTFHTSRWDYAYTGGDSDGGLDRLGDKRVAIIGTGVVGLGSVVTRGASESDLLDSYGGHVDSASFMAGCFRSGGGACSPARGSGCSANSGEYGRHSGGKNLTLPERTPLANLHLTILDKLEQSGFDVFRHRPTLGAGDVPALLRGAVMWK